MHWLLRSVAKVPVLFSLAAFSLAASQKGAIFKGQPCPCHGLHLPHP